jgi:hypothetical protein
MFRLSFFKISIVLSHYKSVLNKNLIPHYLSCDVAVRSHKVTGSASRIISRVLETLNICYYPQIQKTDILDPELDEFSSHLYTLFVEETYKFHTSI